MIDDRGPGFREPSAGVERAGEKGSADPDRKENTQGAEGPANDTRRFLDIIEQNYESLVFRSYSFHPVKRVQFDTIIKPF